MSDRSSYRTFAGALLFLTLMAPVGAAAQDVTHAPEEIDSSRDMAMGTGARASAASTSALAHNPAGLPFGRLYHIEGFSEYVPSVGRWELGAGIVDSMTQRLAAGLAMRALLGNGDDGYSGFDGRLGLGFPLSDAFALGVAGRYVSINRDGQTPEGDDLDEDLAKGFTLDASMTIQPTEGLRLVAFGNNLIDLESELAPLTLGGGAAFSAENVFTIGADVLVDMTTYEQAEWTVGGGAEYLAGGQVPIRAGYEFDHGRRVHTVTGGLGYVSQKVGVDLSLSQEVSGADETRLLASIRYFVH